MKQKGFSLIEVVIGLGILGIVSLFGSTLISDFFKTSNNALFFLSKSTDVSIMNSWIQNHILRGDLRVSGFVAMDTQDGGSSLLIPYPNFCSDLHSNCNGSSAMILPSVNVDKNPLVQALCVLKGNPIDKTILLDMSYDSLGKLKFDSSGITVTPDGKFLGDYLSITPGRLLSFFNEPIVKIYEVLEGPIKFDPKWDEALEVYTQIDLATNLTCQSLIKNRSKLITIRVKPFLIPNTGTNKKVTNSTLLPGIEDFPFKISSLDIYSIGISPDPDHGDRLEIRDCKSDLTKGCVGDAILFAEKVKSLKIFEHFTTTIGGNSLNTRYAFGQNSSCSDGSCVNIPWSLPLKPFILGESETLLNISEFSLYKQNFLNRIEFQVEDISGKDSIMRKYYVEIF